MRSGAGSWVLGTGASVVLHGAGAVVALALVAPEDMPGQPTPGAQFELETTALDRSRAEEQPAEGEAAEGVTPEGIAAQSQGIVRREAPASRPEGSAVAALEQPAPAAAPLAPPAARADAQTPDAPVTQSATPSSTRAQVQTPDAPVTQAATPPSTRAQVQTPDAPVTQSATPQSARAQVQTPDAPVTQSATPQSMRAEVQTPEAPVAQGAMPQTTRAEARPADAPVAVALPSESPPAPSQSMTTTAVASAAPPAPRVSAAGIESAVQAAFRPPERQATAAAPPSPSVRPEAPTGSIAPAAEATGQTATRAPAMGQVADAAPTDGAAAPAAPTEGAQAEATDAPTTQAQAAAIEGPVIGAELAWAGEGMLDPQGLAAVQAFLPEAARSQEGEEVRDNIASLMASVPCARVHTAFNPDTGALELRGHVPTAESRPELVGALQARVGDTLPVTDALRLLPEPQCDVLSGIEALGLPPSEEQFTDPALVGETGWAQDYAFKGGEALKLNLRGADYPAHVYLDYFDGAGNVVHVVPNDFIALPFLQPDEPFFVGPDEGFEIYFSAPFGQDIVVAVATEAPLYEGLRPMVEPAEVYLEFLRARLDELGPLRGEWAYFFVTTTAP